MAYACPQPCTPHPQPRLQPAERRARPRQGSPHPRSHGANGVAGIAPRRWWLLTRRVKRSKEATMAEYERSRLVQASPDDVFAFVSDASNLATFLPTVDVVEPQAEDRVEVHGEVRGRTYEDDGWFRVDEDRRRI